MRLPMLLSFLICVLCCCSERGTGPREAGSRKEICPVAVRAETDRTTATISQTITFTLSVNYLPETAVELPEAGAQIAGLRVIDFGESGPLHIDDRLEYKKWYELQADIAGVYIIPSMPVTYRDGSGEQKQLVTPQIFLEVTAGAVGENGKPLKDIIDIKPLQKGDRSLKPYVIAGVVCLVLIAGAVAVLVYRDRRAKRARQLQKPAHVVALEQIDKLNRQRLVERGSIREHYFELSDIFRAYIENRFAIPAVEQTTQELLPEIERLARVAAPVKSNIAEFLNHSDMVKFAKHVPQRSEIEHNHNRVLSVIHETRQAEQHPET